MTSDTHGSMRNLLFGVMKRRGLKRTKPHSPIKQLLIGAKGARAKNRKIARPITLYRGDAQ